MLASPLFRPAFALQHASDEHSQYRPTKTLEDFNKLLPPAIEFVEGSSTGGLAVAEGRYEPINGTPKKPMLEPNGVAQTPPKPISPQLHGTPGLPAVPGASLYTGMIDTTWLANASVGSGLINIGNTCFLNSSLQCLLHTPPLVRVLFGHSKTDPCRVKSGFCMACNLRQVMLEAHQNKRPFIPSQISSKLQLIAKHMRRGRQEDSHEFLRYAIDALQKSCLAGYSPKIDHKLAETTWVHKIFGGRLRSRVTCSQCGHNSDTFDSILDLSIDIHGTNGLKDALRKFVAIDHLKGADKYKCERCKKPVNAEKQFTVHQAPPVLTVHLKRFTPMGRKIGHPVRYDERLSLQPFMSDGQFGPNYSLYGVICHAGGGPNSGHYYAYVKGANGRWYEMNDESVSPEHSVPVSLKNAYILFYMREKGQALEAVVSSKGYTPGVTKAGLVTKMKGRRIIASDDEEEEDQGIKPTPNFIGPLLPSPLPPDAEVRRPSTSSPDPQAESIKKKIEAAKRKEPPKPLVDYADDDEEGEVFEKEDSLVVSSPTSPLSSAPPPSSSITDLSSPVRPSPIPIPIPTSNFYGSVSANGKKRKSPEGDDIENMSAEYARRPITPGSPKRRRDDRHSGFGSSGKRRPYDGNPFDRISHTLNTSRSDSTFIPHTVQQYGRRRQKKMIM